MSPLKTAIELAASSRDPRFLEQAASDASRAGVFPTLDEARDFIKIAVAEQRGEPLTKEMTALLRAQTAVVLQWEKVVAERGAAVERQNEFERLLAHRKFQTDRIALMQSRLSDIAAFLNATSLEDVLSKFPWESSVWRLGEAGNVLAGLETSAAFITGKLIPGAKSDLAKTEALIAGFNAPAKAS